MEDGDAFKDTLDRVLNASFEDEDEGGEFAVSENLEGAPPSGLAVVTASGVRTIPLPIDDTGAQIVRSIATQAPFGRGRETLVDLRVRSTFQVEPERVVFRNAHWLDFVTKRVVPRACAGLGVQRGRVRASFYKLLLYGPGDHFQFHQDTEKEQGMFGTLVVILPSNFTGGAVEVVHGRETRLLQPGSSSSFPPALAYTAIYTDVNHRVCEVTDGWRLVVSFNLVMTGSSTIPQAPAVPEASELFALMKRWCDKDDQTGKSVAVVGRVLCHQYSSFGLGSDLFKGDDGAMVAWFREHAEELGFRVHVAQFEHHIWGQLEPEDSEEDAEDYDSDGELRSSRERVPEMSEIIEQDSSLSDITAIDRLPVVLKTARLDEEDFCPPYDPSNYEPDEVEAQGYMGNYGDDVNKWYRRTCLIIWPTHKQLLAQHRLGDGVSVSERLAELLQGATDGQDGAEDDLRRAVASLQAANADIFASASSTAALSAQLFPAHILLGNVAEVKRVLRQTRGATPLVKTLEQCWISLSAKFGFRALSDALAELVRTGLDRLPRPAAPRDLAPWLAIARLLAADPLATTEQRSFVRSIVVSVILQKPSKVPDSLLLDLLTTIVATDTSVIANLMDIPKASSQSVNVALVLARRVMPILEQLDVKLDHPALRPFLRGTLTAAHTWLSTKPLGPADMSIATTVDDPTLEPFLRNPLQSILKVQDFAPVRARLERLLKVHARQGDVSLEKLATTPKHTLLVTKTLKGMPTPWNQHQPLPEKWAKHTTSCPKPDSCSTCKAITRCKAFKEAPRKGAVVAALGGAAIAREVLGESSPTYKFFVGEPAQAHEERATKRRKTEVIDLTGSSP